LRKEGDTLVIDPRVPTTWPEFAIEYRFGTSHYEIVVREPGSVRAGASRVTLDGAVVDGGRIPLVDDGRTHRVEVRP
jgi:cyclic beta-1,2-glucan synthetase